MNDVWAILDSDNIVTNTVEWNWDGQASTDLFPGVTKIQVMPGVFCTIGWQWNGTTFINPNAPAGPTNSELYKAELKIINAQYNADIAELSKAWGSAGLLDGATEAAKKSQLQNAALSRQTQLASDISALKVKYGVA